MAGRVHAEQNHVPVVVSDSIGVRCGCPHDRRGRGPDMLLHRTIEWLDTRPKRVRLIGVLECLRCSATWIHGEA